VDSSTIISGSKPPFRVTIVRVFLLFAGLLVTCNISFAQAAQQSGATPPPDEKVQELLKLLDDPEIRTWLARQSPSAEEASVPAAAQITDWDEAIRNHLAAMRAAFLRIPDEAANAARTVRTEINNRGFAAILALFAALVALGLGAEWLLKRVLQKNPRQQAGLRSAPGDARAARFLAGLAPLVVFSIVSIGVFLAFEWPPLLRRIILMYLVAVVAARVVMAIGRALLAPGSDPDSARFRLIQVDDAEAHFWYRRLAAFVSFFMAGWATVSLLPLVGFSPNVVRLLTYMLGIRLVFLAVEAVWRRPGQPSAVYRSNVVNWFLTIYLAALWAVWAAGLTGIFWVGLYALLLPKAVRIAGLAAESLAENRERASMASSVRNVLIVRGVRALVILIAVLWLGLMLRLHPGTLAEDNTAVTQLMRGALQGIITLLVADLLWQLAKAYIDRKLEIAATDEQVDAAEAARRGRLRTLLPIFRNMLAVLIAAVAVLTVLAELGVQIAPLIAGAGIFGVAIGFGSQTLVKDVISGVFYMLDDAFRVGEYIQSRSYKGTVESFSLRSVRLRHHRGPVFTVPFSELGAVENMSRDWAIDKFVISVTYDTDINKVRKLLKGIGAQLLEDPELGPQIIQTVKMKGVEQFGDFGMDLSFAMTTKPGQQTVIRRRAYNMIRDTFAANGIEFAQPTVQVGSDEKQAAAAAASSAARTRKKAALAAGA